MTDETKKLFDAPWKAVEMVDTNFPYLHECEIVSNNGNGHTIATEVLRTDANRIARLPELYDALKNSTWENCAECIHDNFRRGRIVCDEEYDFIENGCPFPEFSECVWTHCWALLKKVRDGE